MEQHLLTNLSFLIINFDIKLKENGLEWLYLIICMFIVVDLDFKMKTSVN